MEQTEIREEEVRISHPQKIHQLLTMFLSKVLPADYVFLSLSVATDILGESKETLEQMSRQTTKQVALYLESFGVFSLR